jgi:hypothetical protein
MLTNFLTNLGVTRDWAGWFWGRLTAGATILMALYALNGDNTFTGYISTPHLKWLIIAAVIVLWLAGKYDSSELPGAVNKPMGGSKMPPAAVVLIPLLIAIGLVTAACPGKLSPKVGVDVADRTAYSALVAFDVAEESAYHAHAVWPTPAQHIAISVKLSQAYQAVVDVAHVGIALPPGSQLSTADLAAVGKLTTVVADIAALVGAPGVGADITTTFNSFQAKASALVTSVTKP